MENESFSTMVQAATPAIIAAIASVAAAVIASWNQIKLQELEEIKAEQDAQRE